jgi:riboflavin biosynthesis pyrimidine reductase
MTEGPLVRRLLPPPADTATLSEAFASPNGQWVRAVFVSSVDGAATVSGHAGGLGNDGDRQLFALNRALADVILVGAGTARAEGYGPAEDDQQWRHLRTGRSATAPLAVVSRSLDLDFDSALFSSAPEDARTIVITCADAPAEARRQVEQVAEVVVAGSDSVDLTAAIEALASKGLNRIVCEGGPRLFTDLLAAGAVDELCLTHSPQLIAGAGPRIVAGEEFEAPIDLDLDSVHATEDGFLYLLYRVTSASGSGKSM